MSDVLVNADTNQTRARRELTGRTAPANKFAVSQHLFASPHSISQSSSDEVLQSLGDRFIGEESSAGSTQNGSGPRQTASPSVQPEEAAPCSDDACGQVGVKERIARFRQNERSEGGKKAVEHGKNENVKEKMFELTKRQEERERVRKVGEAP